MDVIHGFYKVFSELIIIFMVLILGSSQSYGSENYSWSDFKKTGKNSLPVSYNVQADVIKPGDPIDRYGVKNKELEYVPDQIIIKLAGSSAGFNDKNSSTNATAILDKLKTQYALSNESNIFSNRLSARKLSNKKSSDNFGNIYLLKINQGDVLKIAKDISQEEGVEYAEPNYIYKTQVTPNDPFFNSKGSWGQDFDDLWGLKSLDTSSAWEMALGNESLIAVIDTGLDIAHVDIAANVWQNPGEIPNNNIDDDNNGFVDDSFGWNFPENNNNTGDLQGHGTHVSGTIAATINNSAGIVGVAPGSKIIPIKGLGDEGRGTTADLAAALVYAADLGADIINNSWGGGRYSFVIHDAVKYAYGKGAVVVAAAGNASMPTSRFYPAGLPETITVAASDVNGELAFFSNWGMKLDVSAPGVDVLSLLSGDVNVSDLPPGVIIVKEDYMVSHGTSMAAPHVAGQIALMLGIDPDLSPEQVRYILHNSSVDPEPEGFDIAFGFGVINSYSSVKKTAELRDNVPDLFASLTSPKPGFTGARIVEFSGSATGPDFHHYTIEWRSNRSNPTEFTEIVSSDTPVTDGLLGTFDTSLLENDEEVTVRLNVFDDLGRKQINHTLFIVDKSLKDGWPQYDGSFVNPGGVDTAQSYADLNGDGQQEVITATGDTLTVYDSNGKRLHGFPIRFDNFIVAATSIGDIDNDGLDEIIVPLIGEREDFARIHAINYDGSSVAGYPIEYSNLPADEKHQIIIYQSPIIADVDNDGEMDLIVNIREWPLYAAGPDIAVRHQLAVLDASGKFKQGWPVDISKQFSVNSGAMAAVDFEKDGDIEIAVISAVNNKSQLSVYEHNGEKKFDVVLGENHRFPRLMIEDITKDGHYEIVTIGLDTDNIIHVIKDDGTPVAGWPQVFSEVRNPRDPLTVLTDKDDNKYLVVVADTSFVYYDINGSRVGEPRPMLDIYGEPINAWSEIIRLDTTGVNHGTQSFYLLSALRLQKFDLWGKNLSTKIMDFIGKTPVIGDIDNDNVLDIATVSINDFTYVWEDDVLLDGINIGGWTTLGANNARTFSIETPYYRSNFSRMQVRGHINNQVFASMTKVSDYTWQVTIDQEINSTSGFKFDVHGDGTVSFGDSNGDSIAERQGDNIILKGSGKYVITFNDKTLAYSIERK